MWKFTGGLSQRRYYERKTGCALLLELANISLTMANGDKPAVILAGVDLRFEDGKMYALTGPNGGGKSSLARVIMGIYTPTTGRVLLDGEDITALSVTDRARRGFGYAFQHPPRFKGLRVSDLLDLAGKHSSGPGECRPLVQIGLCPEDYLERELDSSLSGGEVKRIEIASLLARDPRVRILDEPEAGIDLWSFEGLIRVIRETHRENRISIIISHQEKILNMVDEIVLIAGGEVQLKGPREEIWPMIKDGAVCPCRQSCRQEGEIYVDCPR